MENLKDIEEIYRKALVNKLKNPSEWIEYTDIWSQSTNYVRTFCFSEEDKVYFKVSLAQYYDRKTIYINEDKPLGNEILPFTKHSFKLKWYDFQTKRLIKKLEFYRKHKKELEELEEKTRVLKGFLPKSIIRNVKLNKIKRLI